MMILDKLADNNLHLLKCFFMGVVQFNLRTFFFHKLPKRFLFSGKVWYKSDKLTRLMAECQWCFPVVSFFTKDSTFRSISTLSLVDKQNSSHSISLTKKLHLLPLIAALLESRTSSVRVTSLQWVHWNFWLQLIRQLNTHAPHVSVLAKNQLSAGIRWAYPQSVKPRFKPVCSRYRSPTMLNLHCRLIASLNCIW